MLRQEIRRPPGRGWGAQSEQVLLSEPLQFCFFFPEGLVLPALFKMLSVAREHRQCCEALLEMQKPRPQTH